MQISRVKNHAFEPGALSIIQMGEELIGHPTTAINELIKNGYDADATEAYLYINTTPNENFIAIYDNGLGMENSTLFGSWLKPSISSKRKENVRSEIFERRFLGSKGIGRLATMALGQYSTVISKQNNEKQYNWLTLNREIFRSDAPITSVRFPGDVINDYHELFQDETYVAIRGLNNTNKELLNFLKQVRFKNFKEGTLIIIEHIDDSIKSIFEREFEELNEFEDNLTLQDTTVYRALSILTTPLQLSVQIQNELLKEKLVSQTQKIAKDNSLFTIFYGHNNIPTTEKFLFLPVQAIPIAEVYDYRVLGVVSSSGDVKGKFTFNRLPDHSYSIEFDLDKNIVLENKGKSQRLSTKSKEEITDAEWNASTGEFFFDIRIYDRGEEDSKQKLFKIINANSPDQKKAIIDNLMGLRISKNGFGVKPYGEEVKDWLNLSQIRVQNPGQNVSINQILGYVLFYSPQNDGLKEKTNREGFYENKAFQEVRLILQTIFKNIGQLRYNYRLRHNLGRSIRNRLQRPNSEEYLSFLRNNNASDSLVKRSEQFIAEITTALDDMEDTLSFSQRLASLGTGLELVFHELAQPIVKIGASRAIINKAVSKIKDEDLKHKLISELNHIGSFVAQLDELKNSLKPAIGKSRTDEFKPLNTFKKVCHLFRKDFESLDIKINISESAQHFNINDFEYPLWISFLNIINNAIYWLKLNTDTENQISFTVDEKGQISISNNGPYIPEEYIDYIFEYGITLKKEKSATGLGLAFTRNILALNGWDISATNTETGPEFKISKTENGKR